MKARGFTLLELLVAISVLSVVSIIAWRGLDSLVATRERLEPGEETLACEQGGITFTCAQAVKTTPNPFFRRVEVRVFHSDADGNRQPHRDVNTHTN